MQVHLHWAAETHRETNYCLKATEVASYQTLSRNRLFSEPSL